MKFKIGAGELFGRAGFGQAIGTGDQRRRLFSGTPLGGKSR